MATKGRGVTITTDDGRELIDGFSGLGCVSLGYHNDRLAEAAKRQMDALPYAPTFYGRSHPKIAELAAKLTAMAAVPMDRALFQCSGSEANDTMIKLLWYRNIARGQPETPQADLSLARLLRQHGGRGQPLRPTPYARQVWLAAAGIPQALDPELLPLPRRGRIGGRVFSATRPGVR